MIGIRLADHSIFPVFRSDTPGGKRLVLTTARDNQERVDIELIQSDDQLPSTSRPVTLGRVTLDDLQHAHGGDPEIDLVLRRTTTGTLEVTATNRATGNVQSVSIDVDQALNEAEFSVPQSLTDGFEPELAPEYPEEPRSRSKGFLLVAVMLLGLVALAAGAWWLLLRAPGEDPLPGSSQEAPIAPAADDSAPAGPEDPGSGQSSSEQAASGQADPSLTSPESIPDSNSVEYRIRRGDTLWDISETFYGTPWLFSELADANEITNPNLIYAESDLEIPDQLRRGDE